MERRFACFALLGLLLLPLFAQTPPVPGLKDVAEQAGFVDALVIFCASANRAGAQGYALQLQQWEQRNHWDEAKPRITGDATLQQTFTNARAAENAALTAHRFKSTFSCLELPQQLHSAAHDPSLTHKTITANQDPMGMGSAKPSAPAAPAAPQPPPPVASAAAPLSFAGSVTVGAMTVTPPPGWTIQKQTPDTAVLKIQTQHNNGVILLRAMPLQGSLQQSLYSAVRASFPGTGLTFNNPHFGTTGGGSQAMYLLDSGTLNRQAQDLAAVGIAIGGNLEMALLVSGTWGGEWAKFRNQMDDMMSAAVLKGETGGNWDPLHPPAGRGGHSGIFFGAAVQNQLNPLGGMDLVARREYVVLLPSGQAYYGLPIGGHVLDMDFAAACRKTPKLCGTYQIEGGNIVFTERDAYGLVSQSSSPFTAGTPGHSIIATYHGTKAFEVLPVHDKKLSGKFTSTFAQTGNIGMSRSVVAQTFIAFNATGTYQKSGFSSASFQGETAGATTMSNRGLGSGNYRFDGYTLTLAPAGGAIETYTAIFENQDPNPKAVFLNDKAFLRDGSY